MTLVAGDRELEKVVACSFSHDGKRIASLSECISDYTLKVWDSDTGVELVSVPLREFLPERQCMFVPDDGGVMLAASYGGLGIWSAIGTQLLHLPDASAPLSLSPAKVVASTVQPILYCLNGPS
jgi:WD40 repeat protein